jgi:chromosome segregation ATPase
MIGSGSGQSSKRHSVAAALDADNESSSSSRMHLASTSAGDFERHASNNNNSNKNNSSSFINMMHKQAVEHEQERQQLAALQESVESFRTRLAAMQDHLQTHTRTDYLTTARKHHGAELELIQLRSKLQQRQKDLEATKLETAQIEHEVDDKQAQWIVEMTAVSHQQVKQEIYQRSLEDKIHTYKAIVEKRKNKLKLLSTTAADLDADKDWKVNQVQSIRNEIKCLEAREQDKNDRIQQLGNSVRQQLKRVSPSLE